MDRQFSDAAGSKILILSLEDCQATEYRLQDHSSASLRKH